jgi:hypothetical protein
MHPDCHQPGSSALRIGSGRPSSPCSSRRLLYGVLGISGIAQDGECKGKQVAALGCEQLVELGSV